VGYDVSCEAASEGGLFHFRPPEAKITRLNEKIATLRQEIQRLNALNAQMLQTEDKQISLTDPDARSMATSGRGSGLVGYNVQSAVDTKHHLIVSHEVTNIGSDRGQLSNMSEQARTAIGSETIEAVADRGYFNGEEILACEEAGITVYLPKPMTSGIKAKGRAAPCSSIPPSCPQRCSVGRAAPRSRSGRTCLSATASDCRGGGPQRPLFLHCRPSDFAHNAGVPAQRRARRGSALR
jgi:hypothetical protein